ncbi:14146_t:CDS:2, partial [Racocetra fulgida]
SILSQHPNIENAESTPIPIPSIPSLKLSQPTSSISNKFQIPTTFTAHRPNPVSNPNNSSNADALLPVENTFVAKSQPTTAATTTNVMASSSIHSDIPPNVVIPMPMPFGSPPGNGLSFPFNNASYNRLIDEARTQSIPQGDSGVNAILQQAQSQLGRGGRR